MHEKPKVVISGVNKTSDVSAQESSKESQSLKEGIKFKGTMREVGDAINNMILKDQKEQAKKAQEATSVAKDEFDPEEAMNNREDEIRRAKKEPEEPSKELEEAESLEQQAKEEAKQQAEEAELQQAQEKERILAKHRAAMEARLEQLKRRNAELKPIITEANTNPLVAISANWSHDMKELAHDLAGQALNRELEDGKGLKGVAKRIWKGSLFREYFTEKYQNEYLAGKRTDEQGRSIKQIIKEQKNDVMERFALGVIENDRRFIHEKAGESLIPADEKTNEEIKAAIMDYAKRKVDLGENIADLNREFKDNIARIIREAIDDGRIKGRSNKSSKDKNAARMGYETTNYLATAKEAARRYQDLIIQGREKIEHDAALAQVMAGFQVYNAEVRNGVRTQAHRNNIDKIVNKLGKSKLGNFVSSEVLYAAVGTVAALTQTGARAIVGAAGGILASSAISGLKERNRITEDRVRMQRDIANGMDYGSSNRKTSKYEKEIGGSLYDMQEAANLTANLNAAMKTEGVGRRILLRAIAEARVRIDYSDAEQKDLIAYSSADKRGKERLDLDIALIRAEKSLSKEDRKVLKAMKKEIRENIVEGYLDDSDGERKGGIEAKDQEFKKLRAYATMKKAGKTLAIGAAVFFGSQEVMAAIDPNKIGIFEKAGLIKTSNAENAKETILASGFGKLRGSYQASVKPEQDLHANVSNPNEIARYEANGYQKIETTPAVTKRSLNLEDVDPSASTHKISVKYDGWAGNGTKFADGNEIGGRLVNGRIVSNMHGTSAYNGGSIDYDSSNIKAFLTIGDSKFEIVGSTDEAGHLVWGSNGVFTTTSGDAIKAIGDNGEKLYRYFEIAADQGVDGDGIQHIIPLATDVGRNTFSGKIQQLAETITEEPAVYTFVKSIPRTETFIREVTTNGIAIAPPDMLRTNLGAARQQAEPTPPAESAIIDEITDEEVRDLIGGDEGVEIMLDQSPITQESQARWRTWWGNLSEPGRQYIRDIVREVNAYPNRYDLKWGNGFRTWLASQV